MKKISIEDLKKSLRDASFVLLSGFLIQVFEMLSITDFGEYQMVATIVLASITPLVNRYLRDK